jgi:hypothetical protein
MVPTARKVLADLRHVHALLEEETRPQTFRILWVAGVGLARAVGHVLQKVDSEQSESTRVAVQAAYDSWKMDKAGNSIFWEFVEHERNQVLKQYEIGFLFGPIDVCVRSEAAILDDQLFCPVADGFFAGEDCRDVLEQAIEWWSQQLAAIESIARD